MYKIDGPTNEDGSFKRWFVYALIAVSVISMVIVSYQGMSARDKAIEMGNKAQQIEKQTKEGSEVFQKIVNIKKGEIRIVEIDKEKEVITEAMRNDNEFLRKYGVTSTSIFIQ